MLVPLLTPPDWPATFTRRQPADKEQLIKERRAEPFSPCEDQMKAPFMKPYWKPALALALLLGAVSTASAADDKKADPKGPDLPPAVFKAVPEGIEDLKAIQKQVRAVAQKVSAATVGLRMGAAAGSGVIVSEDGYILTAGHVSGEPDRDCEIFLADGRRLKGRTLGSNKGIDSGMVKITEKGKWPFVEMGDSAKAKVGQWCLAIGHPGGYRPGRAPVVRLGRVSTASAFLIRTDNTLVGGDSGGPLFDLEGKVIGIHSRIGLSIADNVHVPVETFRETFDRLAKGETWGGFLGFGSGGRAARPAWLGVQVDREAARCKLAEVTEGSPAEKAGFKTDDVITKFDGKKVDQFEDLSKLVGGKKPGDSVEVEVERGEKTMKLKVVLAKRPE
jgi:serine protease Do